jgi:hypothetical protein
LLQSFVQRNQVRIHVTDQILVLLSIEHDGTGTGERLNQALTFRKQLRQETFMLPISWDLIVMHPTSNGCAEHRE